ncbi:MAG: hypothetical protein PHQ81_06655 [Methanofollis sp.]|nr:hypothetical protein [Methanofollis sp.]
MTSKVEILIAFILVLLASSPILPVNLYTLEAGVRVGLATAAYIGGLLVGLIIMLL